MGVLAMSGFRTMYNTANTCAIHEDTSFPVDEDCPVCVDHEDNEDIQPYKEHIDVQDREINRLKKKLKVSEQNYKQLELNNERR